MKLLRQGDILLKEVDKLPTDAQPEPVSDCVVLAHGSATGHTHAFSNEDAKVFSSGNRRFVELQEGAKLVHEEHSTLTFSAGFYEVVRQREYSAEEIRNVAD